MKEIIPPSDSDIVNRLSILKKTPKRKPRAAALGRAQFLAQAKTMRDSLPTPAPRFREFRLFLASKRPSWRPRLALSWVTAVLVALGLFLSTGVLTVSASQGSLPGEPFYAVKIWTEDTVLRSVTSPEARLNLILDLTDRRMQEITRLVETGRPVPQQVVDRLNTELGQSFEIVARMDDVELQKSLDAVSTRAEKQLAALNKLAVGSVEFPAALTSVQALLTQGLEDAQMGQADPPAFVAMVRDRIEQGSTPFVLPPKRTVTSTPTSTTTNTKTHGKPGTSTATMTPTATLTPSPTDNPKLKQSDTPTPTPTNTKRPRRPTHTTRPSKKPGL